jgi:O-antigen/teichoic acid export membrane protein
VSGGTAAGADRRRAMRVVGRLGWGVADQAVSSLSNFAVGLFVARTFGAVSFGAFTLAYVTYSVVINAARGVGTDPLLVRYSGAGVEPWRRASSAATATALGVGVAAGVLSVLAGLVLPAPVGPVFVALGVGLPGLMLQDSWRFAFFTGGRPASALVNDVVWSVLLLVALIGLSLSGVGGVVGCMLAFGGTAWLAAGFGAVQARALPAPGLIRSWLREHRRLSLRYLVENVSISGATQLRSVVLGAVASLAAVGYVRSAELLMGPFLVVLMGVAQVAVPEASLVFHRSSRRLAGFCLVLGGAQAVAALGWGVTLMLVLPRGPGRALLQDLWTPTSRLLPAVMLTVMAACFSTAATSGLRAMGVAWRSLRAQLIAAAAAVTGGAAGAVLGGAVGACWGATAANTLGALVWWYHLRAALADHHRDAVAVPA